jgi:Flp pilus assembly CpaF family ATPase
MSVSSLSTTSSAVRGATGAGATNWLADTVANIKKSQNQGGLLGMLSAAAKGNDGSLKTYMTNSIAASNTFATIAQSTVTSYSSLIAQMASARQQKAQAQKLQDAMKSLQDTQNMVATKNVLDTFIYMPDGSYIDTANSIMTMSDGTQYDVTTGAKYVDPTMIIQMANGSYLDTKNNILTMADGSRIDSVTGIRLSTTA